LLIGSELVLFKESLEDKKIKDATVKEIKEAIRYCMLIVGLKAQTIDAFTEIEKEVMIQFIVRHYGGHTLSEFKLAFDKALIGDLGLPKKEVKAYENFSCEYISRIMSAYREWSRDVYKEVSKTVEETKQLPPANFSPLSIVDMYYQEFLSNTLTKELVSQSVWDTVSKDLKVSYSNEEMYSIVSNAKSFVLNDYNEKLKNINSEKKFGQYIEIKRNRDRLEELSVEDSCDDFNVNKRSKVMALVKWFEKLKQDGVTNIVQHFKK
jgi:hypothetical protein